MDLFAMSTLAGILMILGVIILLLVLMLGTWLLISVMYARTRGGAGRRKQHRPQAVGRAWRLWQGRS
jgi:hypothetical protein